MDFLYICTVVYHIKSVNDFLMILLMGQYNIPERYFQCYLLIDFSIDAANL